MTLDIDFKDMVGPLVSLIAAALSILFFVFSFRLSKRTSDRSLNLEAQKMLLELNRQLIADPQLWSIYDDHPIRAAPEFDASSQQFQGKLEAFAYLYLNMFEIVLFEARESSKRGERDPPSLWLKFFHFTVARSSIVRTILEGPDSNQLYNPVLLAHYEQWKKNTEGATKADPRK
jgi:hypothetical protein